jgi:type II secretory pathway pseudopilin PulG
MFLKNKKLRGMSLVELLAYTVILGIVTTALFQLIHFIQDMNEKDLKQQEIYSEFNLALLKLDTFVSQTSPGDFIIPNTRGSCIENTLNPESYDFIETPVTSGNYILCNRKGLCTESNIQCESVTKNILFKKNGSNPFFNLVLPSQGNYKGVQYDFYVSKSDLVMQFTSFTKYQ